mgnify:FL=1
MKITKPKFWDYRKVSFWSVLLFPLTVIYLVIIWIKKNKSILKTNVKAPIPIICVGNIYLGGTGKTPLVREIFKIAKSLNKNPAFIKKYYNYLSDEIEMLNNTGKTFTNRKRIEGISQAILNNHDVAILDDGYQDFSIKPDFSILCFNSKQMIGNGLVIPSGPLRERLKAISRADCIMINGQKNLEFEEKILKNIKHKKLHIFYSKYKIRNIENFKNKRIIAFAGIGNPSNFFDLLIENNLDVKKTYSFPDHHYYSQKDFEKMKNNEPNKIVTTEKDYYRMNKFQKQNCEYIEVNLEIENKNDFEKLIKSNL